MMDGRYGPGGTEQPTGRLLKSFLSARVDSTEYTGPESILNQISEKKQQRRGARLVRKAVNQTPED